MPIVLGAGLVATAPLVGSSGAVLPEPAVHVPVDPDALEPDPVVGGGVEGYVMPTGSQNWRVKSFAQVGNRIFVGGSFTSVTARPWAGAETFDQAFLAAFDLHTNDFVPSFAPEIDDVVWALEVHDGNLIVGGEFDTVNGVDRQGLVALDPETGAIVDSFAASVDNAGSSYEATVRALDLFGDDLYVVGDFNRLVENGAAHGVYRAARVDADTGDYDPSWYPRASGGGIWDIIVDPARGKIVLVGTFTSMNASASTLSGAVVALSDGSSLFGHPMALNGNAWDQTYAAASIGDNYWLAGEQHYAQVRDAGDWGFTGCVATGYRSLNQSTCWGNFFGGADGGGDYQVAERIDDFIVLGCHCRGNHWNSMTEEEIDLDNRGVRLFRADGSEHDFFPNMTTWNEGPYATFGDTNGCLYLGGDFTGNVDGFGRFCPADLPDPGLVPPVVDPVADQEDEVDADIAPLTITASDPDGGPVTFAASGLPSGLDLDSDTGEITGAPDTVGDNAVTVTVTDDEGESVQTGFAWSITEPDGGGDPGVPAFGTPANVELSTNGVDEVMVRWDPVADVAGYLVHRDWQYRAWVPVGTSFVDGSVVAGETYRYQVRAQDGAGVNSAPSPIQTVTVDDGDGGGGDPGLPPFGPPPNAAAVLNAAGDAVVISWDPVADAAGYLVHRNWQFVAWVPAGTSFTDLVIEAGTRYRYQVRAQDAANNNSAPTDLLIVDVP